MAFSTQPTSITPPSTLTADRVLDELERFVQSTGSLKAAHDRVLFELVRLTGAAAGAIWRQVEGQIEIVASYCEDAAEGMKALSHAGLRDSLLTLFRRGGSTDELDQDGRTWRDQDACFVLHSVIPRAETVSVLGLVFTPAASNEVLDAARALLVGACEILVQRQLRQWDREASFRGAFLADLVRFSRAIQARTTADETAHWIAHEGRIVVGCDRLSVLLRRSGGLRAVAVSGLPRVDPRSATILAMQALADQAQGLNESIWVPSPDLDRLPQFAQAASQYVDETGVQQLCLAPLRNTREVSNRPDRVQAALLVEYFKVPSHEAPTPEERIALVSELAALALEIPLRLDTLPFARLLMGLAKWRAWMALRARRVSAAIFLVVGMIAALVLVPADLWIESPGELQPMTRSIVFAPRDARIVQLWVADGEDVVAGQRLLELRDDSLEYELTRVRGQIRATREALLAARTEKITTEQERGRPDRRGAIGSREVELLASLEGMEQEQSILESQREELILKSPISGRIISWDVAALLVDRPVAAGQILLRVADLEGPWVVEAFVPDDRVGHVSRAMREMPRRPVGFILETDPARRWEGHVVTMGAAVDDFKEQGPSALVTIEPARLPDSKRPGALAVVKIHCGRESLGYVWFHGVVDFARRRIFF